MDQGNKILIAEDSSTQAAQLQNILEAHDYCVSIAENGRQALALMREEVGALSLVISDIVMPEMDGYTLCREIKRDERLKETPVMLLTSLSDPNDIILGLECGADNFLTKPYDEKQLLSRIQYILLNREVRRGGRTQMGMEVIFGGQRLVVTPERQQILDLLISTFETAVQKNLELQRAQEELRALTERLEEEVEERTAELRRQAEILDHTQTLIRNMEDEIIYWNSGMKQLSGWSKKEALGKLSHDLLCTQFPEPLEEIKTKLLRDGVWQGELGHTRRDGQQLAVVSTWILHRDEHGSPAAIVEDNNDITERKRAEEALRQAEEQLRQSQKLEAVGQLTGGIAHDFNNLLTVINGNSYLLLRGVNEEKQRERVEEIKKAGERAAQLTRQLLAFSRKQVMQPVVLNINSVVPDMDKMLRRLIGEDIELRTVLDPQLGQVKADPGQIEQVLLNLALNARDAMPQGGKLTIQTANVLLDEHYARGHFAIQPGAYVMLAVSDTGHGMDTETQARIFEPFFTTKEKGKGTGLGLSTVYGIVKQSGGNIWVYSELGRGTTFKVYLPRVEEAAPQRALESASVKITPQGLETILLVEDEETVRKLARDILEMNGYRVLTAASGSEALRLCEQHAGPIHLLLTDVVMPQMSGREVAERAATLNPALKVLYMSGYTDDSIIHHGVLDAGIAFLEKPFTPDALARKVRDTLDAQQSEA